MAGTSGSIRLEDFVIPRTEKVSQFQVRDGKFLEDNATRVAQSAEERTVSSFLSLVVQFTAHAWWKKSVLLLALEWPTLYCQTVKLEILGGAVGLGESNRVSAGQVHLDRPQETLMWEAFGRCVRSIRAGGMPDEHWPKIAELTQRVVLAVEESARKGGLKVAL